ncbi:hypothetical protein PsorP6_017307 [Peronosclerospora sorghi]|uniref:Uncharacterized protein n=1 Tax=Peronosclerospora sorghi TaxID=230839 RepID=A0ACC0WMT5_9STRA|nr:hypothetical protein PsorP6_017307 [Peronosclerospora sorghi]
MSTITAIVPSSPHNREVEKFNKEVLNLIPQDEKIFLSADSVTDPAGASIFPVEYINKLDLNGWPPDRLALSVGTPMMLLQNLDRANRLCNGTRLLIGRFARHVIEAGVMTGDHKSHLAFIARISLTSEDAGESKALHVLSKDIWTPH